MNGLCYEASKNLDFDPSSAWVPLDNVRMQIHHHGHFVYGIASLGTSIHYSKDKTSLLFGAPGLNDWTGSITFVYTLLVGSDIMENTQGAI